jgi:radical SAM superfamily enzyme YgiQ (UPF0313 family)
VSRKVVLFYPRYDGPPLSAPLCLLSLASPLTAAGFEVALIDAAILDDAEAEVMREAADALCLGISILTGPMIRSAIRISRRVRALRPDLPIIFGGWHPSLVPRQTLEEGFADALVRGQGELTLVELAERVASGKTAAEVAGVSFRSEGQIIHNPDRPVANVNQLPAPAFHRVDFDAYERLTGVRKVGYATSVGCPYACHYCTDQVFYKRRFNAYTAARVVGEVTDLVGRYRLEEVAMLDSNFPVDVGRASEIAHGFRDSELKFRWTFQASTDLLCRMSDEEVQLLGASGVSHMGFGTESASQEVLALMNKKHQRINDMFETARKAERAGIRVTFNLILGYPGETEKDRVETFRVMSDIAKKHANVSFSPNIFTPYPGIPIWPQLKEMGLHEPASLEEWAVLALGKNVLPWLQGEELNRLRRMLEYFLLNNQIRRATSSRPWLAKARRALGAPIRWRLRTNHYDFPWELWVARTTQRLVTRRSLLTGQTLGHGMAEVC